MRGRVKYFNPFILVIILPLLSLGQDENELVGRDIQSLRQVWLNSYKDKNLFAVSRLDASSTLFLLGGVKDSSIGLDKDLQQLRNLERDYLLKQSGLKLSSGFYHNFNTTGADDEFLSFQNRFNIGLDWDLLRGGYFSRKNMVAQMEEKYNIAEMRMAMDSLQRLKNSELENIHAILYIFARHKSRLLTNREKLIERYFSIMDQLYQRNYIRYSEFEEVGRIKEAAHSLSTVHDNYEAIVGPSIQETGTAPLLPFVFDIDPRVLMSLRTYEQAESMYQDSILHKEQRIQQLKESFIHKAGLSIYGRFVNYNIPGLTSVSSEPLSFPQAGISLSLPINGSRSKYLRAYQAYEEKSLHQRDTIEMARTRARGLDFFYKYKLALNDFQQEEKTSESLWILLEKEKEKLLLDSISFNPVAALKVLDNFLASRIRSVELQEKLFRYLVELKHVFILDSLSTVLIPFQQPLSFTTTSENAAKTGTPDSIGLYVWSSVLKDPGLATILQELKKAKVNSVVLSAGARNQPGFLALLDSLQAQKIQWEIMVSNNDLFWTPAKIPDYLQQIKKDAGKRKIGSIHIDIEPHTFKDSELSREKLMEMYVSMLQGFQSYCKKEGMKLAVSIPLSYDVETLKKIYKICDKVYLMAYETRSLNTITRKSQEEINLGADKTVLAVRVEEFSSRQELQAFISQLKEETGITRFVIHDLRRWIKLPI